MPILGKLLRGKTKTFHLRTVFFSAFYQGHIRISFRWFLHYLPKFSQTLHIISRSSLLFGNTLLCQSQCLDLYIWFGWLLSPPAGVNKEKQHLPGLHIIHLLCACWLSHCLSVWVWLLIQHYFPFVPYRGYWRSTYPLQILSFTCLEAWNKISLNHTLVFV